jgi:hypothetical protein
VATVAAVFLGIAVAVLGLFSLAMWSDARDARDDAQVAAAEAEVGAAVHEDHNTALPLNSFAGIVPDNAQELATAHKATEATLPPLAPGDVVKVHMTLKDMVVEIAPGVEYNTWAFDGHGRDLPDLVHRLEGRRARAEPRAGGGVRTAWRSGQRTVSRPGRDAVAPRDLR